MKRFASEKGLILGNLIFNFFFLLQKTEDSQKLKFIAHNKCIEVILPGFFSSSLSTTELSVLSTVVCQVRE